jgi:hypothetical protein
LKKYFYGVSSWRYSSLIVRNARPRQGGKAERSYFNEYAGEPVGKRLLVGSCPSCKTLIADTSYQTGFEEVDAEYDEWSDVVRVFPQPPRTSTSHRIPNAVTQSLLKGDKSIQAGASMAACVMFGRALEAARRIRLNAVTFTLLTLLLDNET